MSYYEQLHPWCIVRLLPNLQNATVARFRRRNDAEAYLRLLGQHTPMHQHRVLFDPAVNSILHHSAGIKTAQTTPTDE